MPEPPKLLLIEDEAAFAKWFAANLKMEGFDVEVAHTGEAARERLGDAWFDLIVTDIRLPGASGLDIIKEVKRGEAPVDPEIPIVALSSIDSVDTAVQAMALGALDYITKRTEKAEIVMRLRAALDKSRLVNENRYLRDQLARRDEFAGLIGDSRAMRAIKKEIEELAGSSVSVLITGETGVGKELVARALHAAGDTSDGPFVDINCAALPDENFFLSEVFGHERGAFTGATQMKKGRFELAENGTLFLDEIGELPLESQVRLLKAIDTLTFTRLGGNRTLSIHCRLLFATNRDLEADVKAGRFREDLFYRVNVYPVHVPPLRERSEDVPALMRFFVQQYAAKYSRPPREIDDAAMALLRSYSWPGNVRELRNIAERLVIRSREPVIGEAEARACGIGESGAPLDLHLPDEGLDLEEVEKSLVIAALEKTDWNQKQAAALLNISPDRMNARVKKFDLRHPSWRAHR